MIETLAEYLSLSSECQCDRSSTHCDAMETDDSLESSHLPALLEKEMHWSRYA